MGRAWPLFGALGVMLAMGSAAAAQQPVVVELFTSEGCSSCPPADRLLATLAERPGILVLSFDVDYWDRLGWKDPFSSAAATARQHDYARLLEIGSVYTPQIVVDGRWQVVGSDSGAVEKALVAARRAPPPISVSLVVEDGRARVGFGATGGVHAFLLLVAFDRHDTDNVVRGENAGRTLTHVDVVRGFGKIARSDGTPQTIEVPIAWPGNRLAALLQADDGRVLGAAVVDLDRD